MGTPSSKMRRKRKEFKVDKKEQQRTLNLVNSINQQDKEPVVEQRTFSLQPKPEIKIEPAKNIDLNSLPKQNTGSDQIIRAIDDVNKRLSKSLQDKMGPNDKTDQEIDNLVQKVKQKAKGSTTEESKANLSHLYSKLGQNSLGDFCKKNLSLNHKQKMLVIKDLRRLERLEDKKAHSLKKERLSVLKKIKSDSAADMSNEEALLKARRNLTRIKPVTGLGDSYSKSYSAIRPLDDLFDDQCPEPIYDRPNDLKQIDVRPDADLLKIDKRCKTIQDLYKVDSDEIRQIVEFVEQKDKENGEQTSGCSYFMKGNEVYSTESKADTKPIAQFQAPKINANRCQSEILALKDDATVRQILHDLILNYSLENVQKLPTNKKVHFNSDNCFRPIDRPKSSSLKSDDSMPNVTKFIEGLEKQNRN
ncbi:hypothetical protein BpHYR1_030887 [Brachionus plicatilis]|uniref:Uncharacterized protein n=1 Tax=Brachionus plicatilis TaxID=10195 RepID=A0A3M7RGA7_BRAPC|nr:hypothetical protein BpHYR1_030887 [Brachionus plicatilis]